MFVYFPSIHGAPPGHGDGGADGAREGPHLPGSPERPRGPPAAEDQGGRPEGAGLRLQGHHPDPTQDRGEGAAHRIHWSTGETRLRDSQTDRQRNS